MKMMMMVMVLVVTNMMINGIAVLFALPDLNATGCDQGPHPDLKIGYWMFKSPY